MSDDEMAAEIQRLSDQARMRKDLGAAASEIAMLAEQIAMHNAHMRNLIAEAVEIGLSRNEIHRITGLAPETIRRWLR
jgi:hypothetical protein